MNENNFTRQLLDTDPFLFSAENQALFQKSYQETAAHHYAQNAYIRGLWDSFGKHPSQIQTEEDVLNSPFTMVHLFKENTLKSAEDSEIVLTLTSSGTGGTKSKQFLDAASLKNVKHLAYQIHQSLGMTSSREYNYLCFTYDPQVANDLGTAFTDELLTQFTGKKEVYYAIQWNESKKDFEFNAAGTVDTLKRFAASPTPTRILGFPAFLSQLIQDHDLQMNLGPDSWLQTGGGWKSASNQEIPKAEFRKMIETRLGIPQAHIRDLFGMVEHGIPYVDCENGELHIPNYARVGIRSPHDLSFRPEGERGLIQFICTYNTSYPAFNLLTTDYGSIDNCTCALGGKILKIQGRAGITQQKGCAIKALELIQSSPSSSGGH